MRTIAGIQLLFVVLLLSTGGCTTVYDARDAKGFGIPRVYDASFDTVWDAIPKAMSRWGLDVLDENEQERYILAVKGATLFSFGENVAVFVDKVDDKRTRVEVVSKKAMEINLLARNWEEPILEELSRMLGSNK
jgi:uncharacterized lipoprotein